MIQGGKNRDLSQNSEPLVPRRAPDKVILVRASRISWFSTRSLGSFCPAHAEGWMATFGMGSVFLEGTHVCIKRRTKRNTTHFGCICLRVPPFLALVCGFGRETERNTTHFGCNICLRVPPFFGTCLWLRKGNRKENHPCWFQILVNQTCWGKCRRPLASGDQGLRSNQRET